MQIPLIQFTDVGFLFAIGTFVLLMATELSSNYYGRTNLAINNKNLKTAAYGVTVVFLITARH